MDGDSLNAGCIETKLVSVTSCTKTEKCGSTCHCCCAIDDSLAVGSYTTGWFYGDTSVEVKNCNTKNVVYCITCDTCGIQYVGQTSQPLKKRFSAHKSSINTGKNTLIAKHFSEHGINAMKIRILEVISGSKQDLDKAEEFWIKAFNVIHPGGLNVRCKGLGSAIEYDSCVSYPINPFLTIRGRRRPRDRGKNNKKSSLNIDQRKNLFKNDDKRVDIFQKLNNLKRSDKRRVFAELLINLYNISKEISEIILAFLLKDVRKERVKKDFKEVIAIKGHFVNRGLDMIGINSIFKDRELCREYPNVFNKEVMVVFTLDQPLSRKVCNYGKFLDNLEVATLKFLLENDCECWKDQKFVYGNAGHVITGDLTLVEDVDLRRLLSYGSKFRIPKKIDWNEVYQVGLNIWDDFVIKHKKKHECSNIEYEQSKRLYEIVLKRRILNKQFENNALPSDKINYNKALRHLEELHKRYIIAPADKAANNFVFICKKILCSYKL